MRTPTEKNLAAPVSRRGMIRGTAAMAALSLGGAGGSLAAAGDAGASDTGRRVPGIQLYTVRDSMAEDVAATLDAIAAIGFREVEFAGYFDHSPADVRALLEQAGLTAPAAHMDGRQLRDAPEPLVEAAAEVGHDYIVIPWLQPEDRASIADYRGWAEVLNRLGERCREHGMRMAYHNHDFEFTPIDGQLPWDVLVGETDPDLVAFELDMFWVRRAGHDPVAELEKAPERCTMAHIKDMSADGEMVDVGAGVIDYAAILADPAASGLKHLFVEHDNPAVPFRTAAIGRRGLSRALAGAGR